MKINVILGNAPNNKKTWGIGYDSNISKDNTCGTSVEKEYLDSILPETESSEEYWLEVAKYAANMLEKKLKDKNLIYEFEFICNGVSYKKTK